MALSSAPRSGPSPKNSPLNPLMCRAARAIAATATVARFSGIRRPANSTSGSAALGVTCSVFSA